MAFTKVVGPGIHTLSNIASHNINSSGIITATKFVGPFDNINVGGATTLTVDGINISAGILTAQTLDLNGNGDISGNLVVHGNLTANGDFTTLNTTLREVELLRVDADADVAAGIITQTGAGHGLVLADDTTLKMAMNVGSGIATFRSLNAGYGNHNGASGIFQQVDLNTAAVTFGNSISVNGATITIGGNSHRIRSAANDFAIEHTTSSYKGFRFLGNVPENTLVVSNLNSGSVGIGSEIPTAKLDVNGDVKVGSGITIHSTNSRISLPDGTTGHPYTGNLEIGNSRDFTIVHDSNHTYMTNRTGNFYIGISDSVFPIQLKSNNTVEIYHGSTKRVETDSLGINVLGRLDVVGTGANDHLNVGTNTGRLRIGGYADLQLYHDSTNINYISNHNDIDLHITSTYGGSPVKTQAKFIHDGAVELYHNDEAKILTQSNGATVQDLTATGTYLSITSSSGNNGKVYGVSGTTIGFLDNQNHWLIKGIKDGAVQLYHDNSPILSTTEIGIEVTGEVAASQDYPLSRPTLDLNFAAQKKLDPRITYQRTGVASFIDKFGLVKIVGDNVPRFDHESDTGECKGLLIEESRTNLQPHSEQYSPDGSDGFINIASNMTVDYDPGVVTPTGETTGAVTFVESGGSGQHYLGFDHYGAVTSGQTYTFSFFVKNISGSDTDNVKVITTTAAFPYMIRTFYFSGTNAGTTSSPSDSTMTKLPNGWWRATFTATTNNNFSQTAFSIDYRGYGSGSPYDNVVALWGIQAELGAFATSYIRTGNATSGGTRTRGIDLVEITEEEFSEFYNQPEGTIVSEIMLKPSFPVTGYATVMMSLSDSSYNNRVTLSSSTGSAAFNADVTIGGTNNRAVLGSYTSGSHSIKAAMAYKQADSAGSLNGAAAVTTSSSPGTLPLLTRADIGKDHGNFNPLNGHIKRIMYYSKRLSNNQLRTLTS